MEGSSVVVYVMPDCTACGEVVKHFNGKCVTMNLSDLSQGKIANVDAMAALAMQDFRAPLVMVDDEPMPWPEVLEIIDAAS